MAASNFTSVAISITIHSLTIRAFAESILDESCFVKTNLTELIIVFFTCSAMRRIAGLAHSCFMIWSFIIMLADTETPLIDFGAGRILAFEALSGLVLAFGAAGRADYGWVNFEVHD